MTRKLRIYATIGIVIVVVGFLSATNPIELLLYREEFTHLEAYPLYHYANFTLPNSIPNPKLSLDIDMDYGNNYTSYTILWILYKLEVEEFEETFNLTRARELMMGEDWDVDDLDAIWAGWFIGIFLPTSWEPLPSGAYVFVFWIELNGSMTGWSATLAVSLRTSILPRW